MTLQAATSGVSSTQAAVQVPVTGERERMATSALQQLDTSVTEEKILAAVERIVAVANPLRIIAFGSRARGDFHPDSDLDLAVIVDHLESGGKPPFTRSTLGGVSMSIDLLVFSHERHEHMRRMLGSVNDEIDLHGIVLYNREDANEQIELLSLASLDDEVVLALPMPDRIFGFHAQQAVEKLLKVLILATRHRHKFTQDIELLQEAAEKLGEALPPFPFQIKQLTVFAVEVRYDLPKDLTLTDRDQIRETIRILRTHVQARLEALNA